MIKYKRIHMRRPTILGLTVGLYLSHYLFPVFGAVVPSAVYMFLFALVALESMEFFGNRKNWKFLGFILPSLPVLIRLVFSFDISATLVYIYGELQVLLYIMIYVKYTKRNREQVQSLLLFCFGAYLITAITTSIGAIADSFSVRYMIAYADMNSADYMNLRKMNIGGFNFIYELVLITPLLVYSFRKKGTNRLVLLASIVVIGFTLVQSSLTYAISFFVLALVVSMLPRLTFKKINTIVFIGVLFILFGRQFIATLLSMLSSFVGETYAVRFEYVAKVLRGETISQNVTMFAGNRFERYVQSLRTFGETFPWGSWDTDKVGMHSFIFDTMGTYGLVGLVTILIMYVSIYRYIVKINMKKECGPYLYLGFWLCLVMEMINPAIHSFVLLFIYPLFALHESTLYKPKERRVRYADHVCMFDV